MTRPLSTVSSRPSYSPVGFALVLPACALLATSYARAEDAADERATTFQAVEGPTTEQVAGGPLLVAAYAVVLLLLVAYVGRLGALQRKTQTELARLNLAVERARKAS